MTTVGGFDIPLWVILFILLVVLLYLYNHRTYSHFNRSGIPGPKPWPFIGTAMELYGNHLMAGDMKMFKTYGKFVGTYEGVLPLMMVYDGEWIKEAFVKNFPIFTNRRQLALGRALDSGLFSLEGDHWKHTRKTLTPEFSSGKLKKMMPEIQKAMKAFVNLRTNDKEKAVNIRRKVDRLTLDVISRTAFGLESDAQTNENSQFALNAVRIINGEGFNTNLKEQIRLAIATVIFLIVPAWLIRKISRYAELGILTVTNTESLAHFENLCKSVIESRRERGGDSSNDFVQTLADNIVEAPAGHPHTLTDSLGLHWTKDGLTENEVIGSALLFLLAGFQTTADTLSFLFYELALHPDIQQKLYEEIRTLFDTEEITPEQLTQAEYLNYCLNEISRLYPQGFRFDRVAAEDVTIKGIFVPKGTVVVASAWVLHRDPAIWENPEDFDPDRFSPERFTDQCSNSFFPFGIGNRKCIGSRLALVEMKMAVVSVLKSFVIERCEETPSRPLQFQATIAILPAKHIMLKFAKR